MGYTAALFAFLVAALVAVLFIVHIAVMLAAMWTNRKYATKRFFEFRKASGLGDGAILDDFVVFGAPASGPRGFVTMGFDHQFISQVRDGSLGKKKRWFIGGSTAALRFCALISSIISGRDLTERAKEHFTEMTYRAGDTPAVLTPMMLDMFNICAPDKLIQSIVEHPDLHLCIMVAHFHPKYTNWPDWRLKLMFGMCFLSNIFSRRLVRGFFKRMCFYTGPSPPPFLKDDPSVEFAPITKDNFRQVLRATTCVPFVSERVDTIPGVPPGLYYDGAICDYHMNVCIKTPEYPMLYLADVADRHIKQTFFDAILPWRGAPDEFLRYCSVISPTHFFVSQIPGTRLPNVSDWFDKAYMRDPEIRKMSWRAAYELSVKNWGEIENYMAKKLDLTINGYPYY